MPEIASSEVDTTYERLAFNRWYDRMAAKEYCHPKTLAWLAWHKRAEVAATEKGGCACTGGDSQCIHTT